MNFQGIINFQKFILGPNRRLALKHVMMKILSILFLQKDVIFIIQKIPSS